MRWLSVLLPFLLGSLEICCASTVSSTTKAPKKKLLIPASSTSVKLDLKILNNLNKFAPSPLKVADKDTCRLALDFDALNEDKLHPSTFFDPKEESINLKESWLVPLHKIDDMKNLMNLESKLAGIRKFLNAELVDYESSLSWVANGDHLANLVLVVSTSFSQLSYLISRLSVTECSIEISKRIFSLVSEHLNTMAKFCEDIMEYSGRFGMTITEEKLQSPREYFESLFTLREKAELKMSDEMFRIFIEFLFGAFASEYPDTVINCCIDFADYDHWLPLPIIYLRERMFMENPGDVALFISHWKERAFQGEGFDSRNLVNLGFLLQLGILSKKTFLSFIESAKPHKSQFKLNEEMIKFLTLLASTPWILPADQDAALLIGNFSIPSNDSKLSSFVSEADKKALMNFFWDFFVGSADFGEIEQKEYEDLCKLIQRLDFALPEISESLWQRLTVKTESGNFFAKGGEDVYEMFKCKIGAFEEIQNLTEKIKFLELNFSDEKTVESYLVDTKTLFILFNFLTDVLADSVEAVLEEKVSENALIAAEFASEHAKILNFCIKFFDTFLVKFAHKSVINHWYENYDFYPTKIFNALNDLWMISEEGFTKLTLTDCLIWENITKLFDYNERFAHIFMMIVKSKTGHYRKPAFSSKLSTPKCLIQNGQANSLNLEYFQELLAISKEGEIFDEFFVDLSEKLASEEVHFDSVEILFREIIEKGLAIKISGYSKFWSPLLMIHLTKLEKDTIQHQLIKKCFQLYLKMNTKMEISNELLLNISIFIGFNQYIRGEICAQKIETSIDSLRFPENLNSASSQNLQNASSHLFDAFNRIIINGVSLRDANTIFLKLVDIAKILGLTPANFENRALLGLFSAFNSLLLSIIRIPNFSMPEEEKSALLLHEAYLNFKECSPYFNENLLSVLRQKLSAVAIYENLIKQSEALPASAFDLPIIKDKRTISKIQQDYMNMLGSNKENMSVSKFNPITTWIRNGKIDPAIFLKLLEKIESDQEQIVANCLPLIAEFIKNDQILLKTRVEALEIIFSEDNDEIIESMANHRLYVLHEIFINLFINGPADVINMFLDQCGNEDWYTGIKIEIERVRNRKMLQMDKKSANLYIIDESYSSDLLEILNASIPNYALRRSIVLETVAFAGKMNDMLPILRDSLTNGPLENCFFHLISTNLQIADGLTFFNHYANPETFMILLKMQVILFKRSRKRKTVLTWLLDSIRVSDTRMAAIRMFPHLITSDNFVLYGSGALQIIQKWFRDDYKFKSFLGELVISAFNSISSDSTIERAPVLDEMFETLCEVFKLNFEAVSTNYTLYNRVLDGLIELMSERKDLIVQSNKLMEFLKTLIEKSTSNDLFIKVIEILKEFPSFYLKNKKEWKIIWKKFKQKLPFEFFKAPVLTVYSKFGNEKLLEWKTIFNLIPGANLPSKVLCRLFIELSDKGKLQDLELLKLLPEKLEIEDVTTFNDVEILLKYILHCLELVEVEAENISKEIYEKLFVLLDFDVKIGGSRIWDWRRILNISDSDKEMEMVAMNSLTVKIPNLLENSCTKSDEILAVIYEFSTLNDKSSDESNAIKIKAVEIYDKLSGTVSNVSFEGEESKVFEYLKTKLDVLIAKNDEDLEENLVLSIAALKEFKTVLADVGCIERNDRYAINSFAFILALASKTFSKNTSNLNSDLLSEFSDLVVEMVHDIINSGNIVGFAQAADHLNLETLISSMSYHVTEKIEEFNEIINESMKFAPVDVADLFYQQISESDFRVDICFFTCKIIKQFPRVSLEDFNVPDSSWPVLYLRTLLKSEANIDIDEGHFEQFECLLEQVSDEMIPDQILLTISNLLTSRPNYLKNILDLIDNLHRNYADEFSLDCIFKNFLTDSIVEALLSKTAEQRSRFILFLKDMKKESSEDFEDWELNVLQSKTQALLRKTLQSDADAFKTSIHTGVAEKMIPRILEVDFLNMERVENLLNSFKNLDPKFVKVSVIFELERVFVNRLNAAIAIATATATNENNKTDPDWIKSIQNCFVFLLNFPVFEDETFKNLIQLVGVKVFSEQILMLLAEKGENREELKEVLMALRSKIDFGMWKSMKQKLQLFKLWEDEEILISVSNNSEPSQFIDLFSSFKNLQLAKKFELLENCRLVEGIEKISRLINFYKNLEKGDSKMIVLKSFMRNKSIWTCFLSNQKKNLKNKTAVLSLLKENLSAREILKLASELDDSNIWKIIVNLYFKASSAKTPIIPLGFKDFNMRKMKDFFLCYFYEIQNDASIRNKTPMYIKAFKLYRELEERQQGSDISENSVALFNEGILISMTDGLEASLAASNNFSSSPETIYSIYKLTRPLVSKKKERYSIMRKLLISSRPPMQRDCIEAFLRAQLDSGNVDWNLHRQLEDNAKGNERILNILFDFELEHYT
jgi:hypothetical protein